MCQMIKVAVTSQSSQTYTAMYCVYYEHIKLYLGLILMDYRLCLILLKVIIEQLFQCLWLKCFREESREKINGLLLWMIILCWDKQRYISSIVLPDSEKTRGKKAWITFKIFSVFTPS